ncbi:MAG: PD-(D/E)XK nuclease family protein [Armatimonadota bacterium]|nr:PD-(D/E)XK nuclease family protein [Armatimonadota bacterium]
MAARKPVLSPTRIATFLECRRLYYYIYVRKFPRYFAPRPWFSLGTSLHRALEQHHLAGGPREEDVAALVQRLENVWVSAGYGSAEAAAAKLAEARQWLVAYHQEAPKLEGETLFLEKSLRVDRGAYILSGRIDRLDRLPDGLLEVVDYKSGERVPTEADVADDLAIAIYQVLSSFTFQCPKVKGSLYHLATNRKVSVVRDSAQLQEVARQVDAVFAEVCAEQTFERRKSARCERCDFHARCWGGREHL